MPDSIAAIKALLQRAQDEGREVVCGELECAFCGAELDHTRRTLRMALHDRPAIMVRLCLDCARRLDLEEGIFGLIHEG